MKNMRILSESEIQENKTTEDIKSRFDSDDENDHMIMELGVSLSKKYHPSREFSLFLTKLEEASLWLKKSKKKES